MIINLKQNEKTMIAGVAIQIGDVPIKLKMKTKILESFLNVNHINLILNPQHINTQPHKNNACRREKKTIRKRMKKNEEEINWKQDYQSIQIHILIILLY